MITDIDVCNKALNKLGHSAITSLEDETDKASRLCKQSWEIIRNRVLRDNPWNFAVKRAILTTLEPEPLWGFTYKHALPEDLLRLLEIRDLSNNEYQLENVNVLSDENTLYIRYIHVVTDVNKMDALFIETVSTRLAFELCETLTQSNSKKELLWQEYKDNMVRARTADAQENPPVSFEEDDWINMRY